MSNALAAAAYVRAQRAVARPLAELEDSDPMEVGTSYHAMLSGGYFTFSLPEPTSGVVNEILVLVYASTAPVVTWGYNVWFANAEIPTIESGFAYRIVFTYIPSISAWSVEVVKLGNV